MAPGRAPAQQLIQLRARPERHHLLLRPQITGDSKASVLTRLHSCPSRSPVRFGGACLRRISFCFFTRAMFRCRRSTATARTAGGKSPASAASTPAHAPTSVPANAPSPTARTSAARPSATVRQSTPRRTTSGCLILAHHCGSSGGHGTDLNGRPHREPAGGADRLTDLLTRRCGTGETARDVGDSHYLEFAWSARRVGTPETRETGVVQRS